jgi:serine protease
MSRPPPLSRRSSRALVAALALSAIAVGGASRPTPSTAVAKPSPTAPYERGEVVVGFRAGVSGAVSHAALARSGVARASTPVDSFDTVTLRPGVSVANALARLRHLRTVAWAVPDYIAHAAALPPSSPAGLPLGAALARTSTTAGLVPPFIPNDPGTSGMAHGWEQLQWNFVGPFGVGAPQAWANVAAAGHPGGGGVTVAVLDTGVAYANHGRYRRSPDFRSSEFVKGYDFISHSPFPEDHNGHGTQVAGTIAEATNNAIGLTGLAYGVWLMPVRVLDSQGDGDASAIASGINYAVRRHVQIINLSLEFTAGTVRASAIPELIAAIDNAHRNNVLVVAASGNEGDGQLSYPAKAKWVVAVGATTQDGCMGYYSNYGSGLTLVAPGGGGDADLSGDPNCHPNGPQGSDIFQETFANVASPSVRVFGLPSGYFGTSMAAPHVSATAALIIASGVFGRHPTVAQIIARLKSTATPLGANGDDPRHYGAGLVNAAAATAPIGPTGPTGPSGPSGPTGATQ